MLKIEESINKCNQICLNIKNNLKAINKEVENIRLSVEMRSMESIPQDLERMNESITAIMELYGELLEL